MSSLVLVRHGQASFLEPEYDRLSALGETQARLLGACWLEQGLRFDAVYCGPRQRQTRTAELAGKVYVEAGVPWPELVILPELDEHQGDVLITRFLPEILREHAQLDDLAGAYQQAQTPAERHRGFQKLFEAVVALWSEGAIAIPDVDSWDIFRQRIRSGVALMTGGAGRGRRVVGFTSVGAITVVLQLALQCTDRMALELGWRLRNCSVSEFAFTRGRFTLDSFNALPHLRDPALWTYR